MTLTPQLASNELNDIARMLDLCKEKARKVWNAPATDKVDRDGWLITLIQRIESAEDAYRMARDYTVQD